MEGISALAAYFTGSLVGEHSVGLELTGKARRHAEEFFKARRAIGIEGYATPEQAEDAIGRKLGVIR